MHPPPAEKSRALAGLMIVGGVGIGQQDGGHPGGGQFGQRRAAGPADGQIGGARARRACRDKRHDRGRQIELAVEGLRGVESRLARLMHDPPARQLVADLVNRPGHVFVQRAGPAAAAENEELGRREAEGGRRRARRGRRDARMHFPLPSPFPLSSPCPCYSLSRRIRSDRVAGHADGAAAAKPVAVSSNAVQTSDARRASQRVALPGTAFCSSSTSGTRRRAAAWAIGTLA